MIAVRVVSFRSDCLHQVMTEGGGGVICAENDKIVLGLHRSITRYDSCEKFSREIKFLESKLGIVMRTSMEWY